MSGGECKIKAPPPHVILGKTQPDQDWIDGEVEVGVEVCGFPRPGPRPASLDAPVTRQAARSAPEPVRKKKGIFRRAKERLFPQRAEPVQQFPAAPTYNPAPAPEPAPAPLPARPKRDPVLEFLTPNG